MITLNVTTHSGADDTIEVESYDSNDMLIKLNDNSISHIAVGEFIYSRIDVKNIKPVK